MSSEKLPVCLIVGTRPEAIKMAPVYRELRQRSELYPVLLSTGQHHEMLRQTLGAFDLTPDFDLHLMRPSQSLAELTGRAIVAISDFCEQHRPAAILVQGDTTSVFAGAVAAFYNRIPVGHVEAGLRTHNLQSPWPEEMNRRLTAPLCHWNFAPTARSRDNLLGEGVPADRCYVTGNTVIDALLWMREISEQRETTADEIAARVGLSAAFAERYLLPGGDPLVLVTGHRRESFGAGFERFCAALVEIITSHPDAGILFPVHLNPAVRDTVHARLGGRDRIELVDPVGYEEFVWLINRCHFIISDSGGIQEEAPSFGKPVLVTRDTTERPEGIEAGTCQLVGTHVETIVESALRLLNDDAEYQRRCGLENPYGDGYASRRICDVLAGTVRSMDRDEGRRRPSRSALCTDTR